MTPVDFLQQLLAQFKLTAGDAAEKEKPEQLLEEVTFEGIANYIKKGKCKYNTVLLFYHCLLSTVQPSQA